MLWGLRARSPISFLLFKCPLPSPTGRCRCLASWPPGEKGPRAPAVPGRPRRVASGQRPAGCDSAAVIGRTSPRRVYGRRPSASRGPEGTGARARLGLRDRGVAVPVVDLDVALAPEVGLEDVAVAVVPPPGAQLAVPGAVQHVEELGVLHADHGEEVLVAEVAAEAVLVRQLPHPRRLQQAAVEGGLAQRLQVQQHHPAVEAGEPLGGRAPHPGLGVLLAELPERVPGKGKEIFFLNF